MGQEQGGGHYTISSYAASYIGRRSNNEDCLGRKEPRDPRVLGEKGRLFVVSDGMGGYENGEIASSIAVSTIIERYYDGAGELGGCLRQALIAAHARISECSRNDILVNTMGATATVAVILANRLVIGHIGDSRLYILRNGNLRKLTRDHLHIIENEGLSEYEAEHHQDRNVLSRALGIGEECAPEIFACSWEPSDRLLLCTDGLSNALSSTDMQSALMLE